MKLHNLTDRRKDLIRNTPTLDINVYGDIVYSDLMKIVDDEKLYKFFEFNNV